MDAMLRTPGQGSGAATGKRRGNLRGKRGVGVGVLYSITTFMREITPLLQIRQVARLMEHDMQPEEIG